jgi:hypothetical protein
MRSSGWLKNLPLLRMKKVRAGQVREPRAHGCEMGRLIPPWNGGGASKIFLRAFADHFRSLCNAVIKA